ncbi:MAG: 5'-methylthioadenosine/adenosylhomocysteine nucleosidase [Firmicutes bacterium]|nr:5'-methylthioadenosine/adenosylhomocysteine nucleosidase [Bacillota bacterium]
MRIAVIGAMEIEVQSLLQEITSGKIGNAEVIAAFCGAGKVNAALCTQAMILKYAPNFVVNIGVAGGLDPALKAGELLLADSVVQYDLDTTAFGDPPGLIPKLGLIHIPCAADLNGRLLALEPELRTGCIASGDRFVTSAAEGARIYKKFGAAAVDMESGSIGHVCYVNQIPFTVLRAISDRADAAAPGDFDDNLNRAALKPIELLLKLLYTL